MSTIPYDGLRSVPTASGESQRPVMPANSNASPGSTRSGRLRPNARNVRLASVPEFQRQLPPIWKPLSQKYDELILNRCAIEPGWSPHWWGARGSSQITSPWKSALESELVLPVAWPYVYAASACQLLRSRCRNVSSTPW